MNLIDLFKRFHTDAIQQEFPPSARVLYYTLLGEFNRAYWAGELVLSERELIKLTSLPKTTINEAKRFLASRGIIKITKFKGKTAYSLTDHQPTSNRPVADHQPTTLEIASITRAREDVKTLDVKTKKEGTRERELSEIWLDEMHRPLGASERYELADYEEQFGYEKVKDAIIATRQSRTFPTFTDLKNILKGVNNGKSKQPIERSHEESANVPWEV